MLHNPPFVVENVIREQVGLPGHNAWKTNIIMEIIIQEYVDCIIKISELYQKPERPKVLSN